MSEKLTLHSMQALTALSGTHPAGSIGRTTSYAVAIRVAADEYADEYGLSSLARAPAGEGVSMEGCGELCAQIAGAEVWPRALAWAASSRVAHTCPMDIDNDKRGRAN